MGEPSKIVGIEIEHDPENKTISIGQVQYINSILQKWGMTKANKVAMPIDPHLKLEPSINDTPSKSTPYALLIGLLMHATVAICPDIAYTVLQLTAFMTNPDLQHWTTAKHVLRYLAGMQNLKLKYMAEKQENGPTNSFYLYSDADFANTEDCISISGYVSMLSNVVIMWSTKK